MANARARRPGRRPVEDDADLRGRLVDAALAAYAATGVRATTNRAIARSAGVNPALVNYYFGDRLTDAVVEERILPALGELLAAMGHPPEAPLALATRFVDAVSAVIAQHPWLPPLWMREVLVEGGAFRHVVLDRVGAVPRAVASRLAESQRAGQLDGDLDPRLVVVSLVGLTLFTAASAPIWRHLFAADDLDVSVLRRHAHALLAHGLAPPGALR
ncbi:TetR/AcrR family transcriptional regulator [Lysobacter sp. TY2-98]|uniref:TetR/AcrR family transcriptional regulator n=1 Tax=Lysobacter sp. TY2-98 TaxID=2290922 RepID=UPI000E204288|nr:TetR/AcrR family transcriptional regulator [Lysobacter sp. TY2-98]AXK71762.1 TetR/AcrR family transcriptional regulator [Lysobacter sp. TY2-98]